MPPRIPCCLLPGFLDAATCRRFRAAMDRGTSEAAEVLDSAIVIDEGIRRASSIEIDPQTLEAVEGTLDEARTIVEAYSGLTLGAREGPSFLRYGPGGFYRRHCDQATASPWPQASRRQMSLVLFLTGARSGVTPGEFDGGELLLFPESAPGRAADQVIEIVPQVGCLAIFPATMPHEVRPVLSGVRDVIVDWFY
jgi:predicted 2-oxoglutarate/Fe(II)-dependent dioxygenase YbiX